MITPPPSTSAGLADPYDLEFCSGGQASCRRRRSSTERRWRSSRNWPTSSPPSPDSETPWRTATKTWAPYSRKRASRRRRRPSSARGWRSGRSWPTTTPRSSITAARSSGPSWRSATWSVRSAAQPRPAMTTTERSPSCKRWSRRIRQTRWMLTTWLARCGGAASPAANWATPPAPRTTLGGRCGCTTGCRRETSGQWFATGCCRAMLAGLSGSAGSGVSAAEQASEADAAMALLAQGRRDGFPLRRRLPHRIGP